MMLATSTFAPTMRAPLSSVTMSATEYAKTLPGAGPFGFFDPLGLLKINEDMTEGSVRYWREVEVKHGRVAMLAAVGFFVGEKFHPLFGGDINVPSYIAFQATPLQEFWTSVVLTIGIFEFFSIVTIDPENAFQVRDTFPTGEARIAGDFMFDPLGLKPKDPVALKAMQEKEINNGRCGKHARSRGPKQPCPTLRSRHAMH
jgi:hypothetical protein